MSWAKFKSFANQFLEDATHASNLVVAGVAAGVVGGGKTMDVKDHWIHVRTFFRDAQNHSDPNQMAARLPEVEAELEKIISLMLEERPQFLKCLQDSSLDMPSRYDYILGGAASTAAEEGEDLVDSLFDDNPDRESGRQLITTVCQYAKHDIPEGSRAVILRFLTRLFRDVDAAAGSRSLLHYSNDFIAMPLLDAIERIFNILNPWAVNGLTALSAAESSEASGRVSRNIQKDRVEFVALLHALSMKVENIPSVAAIFMVKGPSRGGMATNANIDTFGGGGPDNSLSSSPIRGGGGAPRLLLVEGLVPFIKDYVVDLPDRDRIGTTRKALAGILSIARTPDPTLRETLASHDRIVHLVTQELCHTLVTAAKIPLNSEFSLNVAYVCDAVSFLDAIVLSTPYVAHSWHIRKSKFVGSFLKGTVRMLLMSMDERVYSNTAYILALLLQTQSLRSEPLRYALSNFLFEHDPELAGSSGEVMEDLEANLNGTKSPPIPSLFETAIVPRIHDVSDLSVSATLTLTRVLMEQLPASFMRHVLNITTDFKIPLAVTGSFSHQHQQSTQPQRTPSTLVPVLHLDEFFPKALVADKGLWDSTTAVFANDVLRRLLLIESMLSGEAGETLRHQPKYDDTNEALFLTELGFAAGSVPPPAEVEGNERLRRSVAAAATAHLEAGVYCLPHLNSNPFIAALSAKMATFTEHAATVNIELTGVASSLCLLPDCRIFYTLFDKERRGAFATALARKASQIDALIVEDKEKCTTINRSEANGQSLIASSKLTLYKALLANKKDPFAHYYHSGVVSSSSARYVDPFAALGAHANASSSSSSSSKDQKHAASSNNNTSVSSDVETRRFIEACLLLEGFRHEMKAIIGQVEVSLKLMELDIKAPTAVHR